MERKILFFASVEHTCGKFLVTLLQQHPEITTINTMGKWDEPILKERFKDSLLYNEMSSSLNIVLQGEKLEEFFFNLSDKKIILVGGHICSNWVRLILMYKPFEFHLVTPIRNPYSVLRSHVLRYGKDIDKTQPIRWYLELIHILKQNSNNFTAIPIDLLSEATRRKTFACFFKKIGISMVPSVEKFIQIWSRIGEGNYNRDLTKEEHQEIERQIRLSKIIEKIQEIGIDYTKERFDIAMLAEPKTTFYI